MAESSVFIINGLFGIILAGVGIYVKSTVSKINAIDERHTNRYERLRDRIEANQEKNFSHQDKESEKLRKEISKMSESLRAEMAALNGLMMKLLTELHGAKE